MMGHSGSCFPWTNLWLLLFLFWTFLSFRAGYWARGRDEINRLLSKIFPPDDPDDPPEKARV